MYLVTVKKQGLVVSTLEVTADSGAAACDEAERQMGLKPPRVHFDQDHNLVVAGWHGMEFQARCIS